MTFDEFKAIVLWLDARCRPLAMVILWVADIAIWFYTLFLFVFIWTDGQRENWARWRGEE